MKYLVGGLLLFVSASAAVGQGPVTPLFASDAPIQFTIQGPINSIVRTAERSPSTVAATLSLAGSAEVHAIRLTPRGISRRRKVTCDFPPLRVELAQPAAATSLFAGQRRLKLVTHCRSSSGFQQHLLLEYAAYRMFNVLSPLSHRARLATVSYVEANGKNLTTRLGFFIEDLDDVARRNGMRPAVVGDRISSQQLEARQAARVALFEYMIGNLDWSMRAGPAGEGCCHNSRLLSGASAVMSPVPYDFDYSGLVDAPYAIPPEQFRVNSVRTRVYQGFCRHNGAALAAAVEFRAARPSLEALFSQIPAMEDRTRRKALSYLSRFFEEIATDQSLQSRVLKGCMG
jgi:hypothetical protein